MKKKAYKYAEIENIQGLPLVIETSEQTHGYEMAQEKENQTFYEKISEYVHNLIKNFISS